MLLKRGNDLGGHRHPKTRPTTRSGPRHKNAPRSEITVIDYIEGIVAMKQLVSKLEDACRHAEYERAKELCLAIVVETRAVNHQITIQASTK
jgi:hypothetical protein